MYILICRFLTHNYSNSKTACFVSDIIAVKWCGTKWRHNGPILPVRLQWIRSLRGWGGDGYRFSTNARLQTVIRRILASHRMIPRKRPTDSEKQHYNLLAFPFDMLVNATVIFADLNIFLNADGTCIQHYRR